MISAVVFLFAFCGCVLARTPYQSNQYIDTVLYTHLPNEGRFANIDPARLTNFTDEKKDKVAFISVKVNLQYYNGTMTGMFRIRRSGDCSAVRRDYGNVTLNCTLVFNDIKFNYQAKMKYGKMPTTTVRAESKMNPTYIFAEVTTSATRNWPFLRRIHTTQTGRLNTKMTGLGPLNKDLAKLAKDGFDSRIISEFHNVLSYNFIPAFQRAVARIQMPSL